MVLFDRGENSACFLFFGFPKSIILSKVMVDILVLELQIRMGKLDQSPNFKISASGEILCVTLKVKDDDMKKRR